jgi:hypothetical protein
MEVPRFSSRLGCRIMSVNNFVYHVNNRIHHSLTFSSELKNARCGTMVGGDMGGLAEE